MYECCSDTSTVVTGNCTTSFRAEPVSSQGSSKNDIPSASDYELSEDPSANRDSKGDQSVDEGETDQMNRPGSSTGQSLASLHPSVSSGDFDKVVQLKAQRELTDREKFYLLKNHIVPSKGYCFPGRIFGQKQRHFQHNWLERYNGLVYSDGGYCKFCVLFSRSEAGLSILVTRPMINFKKASEKLNEHFATKGRKAHVASVEKAEAFRAVMENRAPSIDRLLSCRRAQLVAENRSKLKSIAATIIFCGRQALSLRGHRDDGPVLLSETLVGRGNFQALLQFRIDAGDEVLRHNLETADRNATYTSKEVQNEMMVISGDIIRNKIQQKIRDAQFFSVIADEATDSANAEQLSISVRYVENGVPNEKFLGFNECRSGVTGEAIASYILAQLSKWQLEPQFLRGQAYDGAGAMAGKAKGAAAIITSEFPKALFTHCAAHRLNLCVVKCCSIRDVNNMMQTADTVARFFNYSPKRQVLLETWIDNIFQEERRKKLKEMCKTRWVERHEAFTVFSDLFLPIVSCLEEMSLSSSSEWNRETRSDAQSLLLSLSQFSFIVTLVASHSVLAYTKGLSVKLQGPYVDVARAHREVETVKATLEGARCNVDAYHARLYSQAKTMAQSVGIDESMPRLASRQQHRSNVPARDCSAYYRLNLTIPLLDHLITELNTRFDATTSQHIADFMSPLPSNMITSSESGNGNLVNILQLYEDDLPSPATFSAEFDLWSQKWNADQHKAAELSTPEKALVFADSDFYPNIRRLLKIMATLPVTSCECERSISMLKLVKSPLRSTMG